MLRSASLLASTGLAALTVIGLGSAAHAATVPPTPHLSSATVVAGTSFTVSGSPAAGTGCVPDPAKPTSVNVQAAWIPPIPLSEVPPTITGSVTPAADGSWSVTVAVPRSERLGRWDVYSVCDTYTDGTMFRTTSIQVLAPEPITGVVSSIEQGRVLSLSGSGCTKVTTANRDPFVGLSAFAGPAPVGDGAVKAMFQPAADGTWTGQVVVDAAPGTYTFQVACSQDITSFDYVDATLTVTAPTTAATGASTLPFTGSHHTTALTATGLALVVGGAGAFGIGRRRRTQS